MSIGQKETLGKFYDDGYILVKNALPNNEVDMYNKKINGLRDNHKIDNPDQTYLHMFDFFEKDKEFLNIFKVKQTMEQIIQLLSTNIYMYHAHLDVNESLFETLSIDKFDWHFDSKIIEHDIGKLGNPMLSVKVGYRLSDVSQAGRGNLMVIPGSHKWIKGTLEKKDYNDAIPILAEPGDAVLFDRRIWHARSTNVSGIQRRAIFVGYTYRWMAKHDLFERSKTSDPVINQLLGFATTENGFYRPKESDLPLIERMNSEEEY